MGNHGGLALTTAVDSFKRNIIFPIYFILKHFTQRKGPNASQNRMRQNSAEAQKHRFRRTFDKKEFGN